MRSIFKYVVLAVFCSLFMMQSVAVAQDKSTQSGKPEKAEKTEKVEKTEKTIDGLAPVTLKDLIIEFPEVEGWERGEIQKYPTEALGLSVNYKSRQGGNVTIYVYNGGKENIPDGASDKLIKDEWLNAKNEIRNTADRGYYENLKELKNETVTLDGESGKVKALRALYNFSMRDTDLTSEIYIFGHQNRFIKIRATRPKETGETGNKMVENLLGEVAAMFSN